MRPLGYVVYFGGPEENVIYTSMPNVKILRERLDVSTLESDANFFFPNSRDIGSGLRVVETIARLWYRDEKGVDHSVYGGISIGSSLQGAMDIAIAACLRNYAAISSWKDRLSGLVVSESENQLFKIAAAEFGSFISYRPAESNEKLLLAHFEERDVSKMRLPSIEPLYRLAHRMMRILTSVINSKKARDQETVLVIGDWTNKNRVDLSSKHFRYTNRWSLQNGAFLVRSRKGRQDYLSIFPLKIDDEIIRAQIRRALLEMSVLEVDQMTNIILKVVNQVYVNARYALADMCAVMSEAIKFYQPIELEITSDRYEPFAVAAQIAAEKGIHIRIIGDGHDTAGVSPPSLRSKDNSNFLANEFCVAGDRCAYQVIERGSPREIIKAIDSPMLSIYKGLMDQPHDIKFSVIIMTWIPRNDRIGGLPDSPFEILFRALEIALEKFSGYIGIKIKHELERPYVELCVRQLNAIERVKILTGYFYEHIFDTRLVIGGISTAVAECMIVGVPYIVFEPYNNGYDDGDIFGVLSPFDRNLVARDEQQLRKLVEDPTSSVIITREEMLYSKVD